jgi:hypothetical protein
MKPIEKFVEELRAWLGDEVADAMATALRAVDIEGDGVPDACAFMQGVEWILAQPRTVREKFELIDHMRKLDGKVTINMREFSGWR